jgi:hypothetical protein
MMGQKVGLGVTGPIASRTNTNANPRTTKGHQRADETGYLCAQTNYDTHIKYNTLDSWAKFPTSSPPVRRPYPALRAGPHHDRVQRHQRGCRNRHCQQPCCRT